MGPIVIIYGLKHSDTGPVPSMIYCGNDGVEGAELAVEAAKDKPPFFKIIRLTNPGGVPLPIDPTPMKFTTPVEAKREAFKTPKQPEPQPKPEQPKLPEEKPPAVPARFGYEEHLALAKEQQEKLATA